MGGWKSWEYERNETNLMLKIQMLTRPAAKKLDVLSGIARGIIADKLVNRKEALFFKRWIKRNTPRYEVWPWPELLRIAKEKTKGNDRRDLLMLLKKLSRLKRLSFKVDPLSTRLAFPVRQASITFKNKSFCLTGVFKSGRRSIIRQAIERKGGTFHDTISIKNTDYLVVGTYASPSWPSSHLGRKLEAAKLSHRNNRRICVVSEDNLMRRLKR